MLPNAKIEEEKKNQNNHKWTCLICKDTRVPKPLGGCVLSLLEVEDHLTEGTQLETEDAQMIRRAKTNQTLLENS